MKNLKRRVLAFLRKSSASKQNYQLDQIVKVRFQASGDPDGTKSFSRLFSSDWDQVKTVNSRTALQQ